MKNPADDFQAWKCAASDAETSSRAGRKGERPALKEKSISAPNECRGVKDAQLVNSRTVKLVFGFRVRL